MSVGVEVIAEQDTEALSGESGPAVRQARRTALLPRLLIPLLLAICAFALAYLSPVGHERSDAWGALLTSQAIVQQGTARLDAYPAVTSELWYRIVRRDGHTYYAYPMGTPLLAAPAVWAANLAGLDMARDADERLLQNWLSALSAALAALLSYQLCRRFVGRAAAAALAASFVFATVVGYTLATALWSINAALVFNLGALLLFPLSSDEDRAGRGVAIGLLAALAYICRPTAALFAALLFLCAAVARRRTALGMAAGGAAGGLLFLACALLLYGSPVPPYYASGWFDQSDPLLILVALAGHLGSPSRGLLVWSPQLLVVLAGVALCFGRLRREPLFWLALAWAGLHLLVISRFRDWPGGLSYGNRLFADVLPATLLLGALAWRAAGERLGAGLRRAAAGAFLALSLAGALIYSGQGLFNPRTLDWAFIGHGTTGDFPAMVLDWRFPQFLASDAQLAARRDAYYRDPIAPNQILGRPVWPPDKFAGHPAWQPPGITLGPRLGAMPDLGWYPYDPAWGGLWMRERARLWLASEHAATATLRLTAEALNAGGAFGTSGTLAIYLGGELLAERELTVGQTLEMPLALPAGVSELRLSWAAGEAPLFAATGDPRPFAVAVGEISITEGP